MKAIVGETYQHYRGRVYQVIAIAKHTEEDHEFVIYKDNSDLVWARPKEMWEDDSVIYRGGLVSRFTLVEN